MTRDTLKVAERDYGKTVLKVVTEPLSLFQTVTSPIIEVKN